MYQVSVIYKGRSQDILASLPFLVNKKAHLYIEYGKRIKRDQAQSLASLLEVQPYIASINLCTTLSKYKLEIPQWNQPIKLYNNYTRNHIVDCTHWLDPRWKALNNLTGDARRWLFEIYNQPYIQQQFLYTPKVNTKQYIAIAFKNRYQSVEDFSNIQTTLPKVLVPQNMLQAAIVINSSKLYIGNNQVFNYIAQGLNANRLIARSYGSDLYSQYQFRGLKHLIDLLDERKLLKERV